MHGCSRDYEFLILMLPRRLFTGRQAKADELIGATVPAANEALRLLRTYADMLLDGEGLSNPAVLAHAGQTLTDLAVLAFGTDRDNTEAARASGLRAARLAAVLRQIRLDYADPEISPERIAGRVGISTRYLHELLQETGISCAERIQEPRLEAAFAILCRQTGKNRKVSDTAYAVGFNDVSYFNRCFRRKFGITPTGARGPRNWGRFRIRVKNGHKAARRPRSRAKWPSAIQDGTPAAVSVNPSDIQFVRKLKLPDSGGIGRQRAICGQVERQLLTPRGHS
jgi:AraC-like DNA-binding protein